MLEEAPVLEMPPRSRLYSLAMAGTCGATQESLLDYAQRLSLAHCVKVRHLFADVILPEANLTGVLYRKDKFNDSSIRGCSGLSRHAFAFLDAMEQLTGRNDLVAGTLTPWAGLLTCRGYAAASRRWCAHCLDGQHGQGFFSYSLLWSLKPVLACPLHRIRLSEQCDRCSKKQPIIGDAHLRGMCNTCHAPLVLAHGSQKPVSASTREIFIAEAASDMIVNSRLALKLTGTGLYQRRVADAATLLCRGSIRRLALQIEMSRDVLMTRPSLSTFFEITYRLGVKPVDFLNGISVSVLNQDVLATKYPVHRKTLFAPMSELTERVAKRLAIALMDEHHVTSGETFASDLGCSCPTLYKKFPEAMKELTRHNAYIRYKIQKEKWRQSKDKISAAMQKLINKGGPYTALSINKALVEIGFHIRHPDVRKLAKEALATMRGTQI